MIGMMAKSLSGHDAGNIYVIVGEEERYVYLANGKEKTVSNPKKKNKKHIQAIKHFSDEVKEFLVSGLQDPDIKRAIKIYQKSGAAADES